MLSGGSAPQRCYRLLADTLVVVTADHGETFWEHPNYWNHGLLVHQTDVHVPLLVRCPDGRGAGGRTRRVYRATGRPVAADL